jgi:hypothetical protein
MCDIQIARYISIMKEVQDTPWKMESLIVGRVDYTTRNIHD